VLADLLHLFQEPLPQQAGSNYGGTERIHPVGVVALGIMILTMLVAPRRLAVLPIVVMLCFIPTGQRLVLFTIDFTFIRLLFLSAWLRLFIRREVVPLVWNNLDRTMVTWSFVAVLAGTAQLGTLTAFINRAGMAVDAMMIYFFFRMMIRTKDDLAAIAAQFIVSGCVVVWFFVVENRTTQNLFYVLGGVSQFTEIRDGRLRCQGAFAHPILAGCFWACLLPFYFLRGQMGRGWFLTVVGTAAAIGIVLLCASSTPMMAILFGLVGAGAYFVRGSLRWFRWLIVLWLLVLHWFLMKQPVWHLLARVDLVGGSTGWHRYHLVDKCIANFNEWWWLGTPRTGHWGIGLQDVTNQYVAEGIQGGIWQLILFCTAIYYCFAGVSRSMRMPGVSTVDRYCAWALGTALFMHCMNFIGVSYFEQIFTLWYLTLAAIGSLTLVPGASCPQQLAMQSPLFLRRAVT
jgi:hypothetical protein